MADKVQIPDFMSWAIGLGEEKLRSMVRGHLAEMHEHADKTHNTHKRNEYWWDDILTPNDDRDQWRRGGDCNLCSKTKYCKKKCRANRTLKKASTPFLYQAYLTEYPEADALIAAKKLTPDQLLKMLGIEA